MNLPLIAIYTLFIAIACLKLSTASYEDELDWINKMEQLDKIISEKDIRGSSKSTGISDFNVKLECEPKPTSVHELRPQDIDVVGAMGDSITAGNGAEATTVPGIIREYRGVSWTIGGEESLETSITLPNILRKFNPQLKGYSIGSEVPTRDLWFNVAIAGSRSRNIPDQARELISRMKNDTRTNYENDWKVVSLFIGGNDLCALGRSTDALPMNYIKTLEEGLDILHAELPRTLVNIINILEIYLLPEIGHGLGSTAACRAAQETFCNYVVTANGTVMDQIKEYNKEYQRLTEQLVDSGKYDRRDDFTVVVQPFLKDTVLPYTEDGQVDSTFFAPDCFHFSTKGHAMGAINLWNNMLEPVGSKTTQWGITDLKCPTKENPYIFTRKNSMLESSGDEITTPAFIPGPETTKHVPPVEIVTCDNTCSQAVPDWGIAVLAVVGCALVLQMLAIVCIMKKKKPSKKMSEVIKNDLAL